MEGGTQRRGHTPAPPLLRAGRRTRCRKEKRHGRGCPRPRRDAVSHPQESCRGLLPAGRPCAAAGSACRAMATAPVARRHPTGGTRGPALAAGPGLRRPGQGFLPRRSGAEPGGSSRSPAAPGGFAKPPARSSVGVLRRQLAELRGGGRQGKRRRLLGCERAAWLAGFLSFSHCFSPHGLGIEYLTPCLQAKQ